jgi:hypothetical protein
LGEITLELRLVFQIPESGLTINGLIGGLKQSMGQIHWEILESVMKAVHQDTPARASRKGLGESGDALGVGVLGVLESL